MLKALNQQYAEFLQVAKANEQATSPADVPMGPFTKEEEELKRAKALARDPAKRWLMIQEMIT